jgi:hypothetical protein
MYGLGTKPILARITFRQPPTVVAEAMPQGRMMFSVK